MEPRGSGFVRSILSRGAGFARESIWYAFHKLTGSSYVAYYASRMDSIVSRNPAWGLSLDRSFQLDYLRTHGLAPGMALLDYGCGALAAGILFIQYLDTSRYFGVDISSKALEEGRRRLGGQGLEHKKPTLVHLKDLSLAGLEGRRFDVIWAQSVFTHMPPDDIRAALAQLRTLMDASSRFYATYGWSAQGPVQKRYKDWYYNLPYFNAVAKEAGLAVEEMGDWRHPADPEGLDRMLRFQLGA
jgi:ubiquinone/menaquinone biosynthesis C-methylase UbiE